MAEETHKCSQCEHEQPLRLEEYKFGFMKASCEECGHEDLYIVERLQPGDTPESADNRKKFYEKFERVKEGFRQVNNRSPFSDKEFKDFYYANHEKYEA